MGKVIRKSGFLGLGKGVEEWYCDKCGKHLGDRFLHGKSVYCEDCANSIDPIIVHGWFKKEIVSDHDRRKFFTDTKDGKQKIVEHCYKCHGLLIHIREDSKIRKEFYQVGHKKPQHTAFKCECHSGYDENGSLLRQATCQHSWVTIATSKRNSAEAEREYRRIKQENNPMLKTVFGVDDVDLQYACFGATHYWCSKCGLYFELNPQREGLLPSYGEIVNNKPLEPTR